MRNLLIFMLLVGLFVIGRQSSCHGVHFSLFGVNGTGPVQTENRTVSDFHAVNLDVFGDVEVTVGESYAVEVSAQQNILPIMKTVVENGTLRIYSDENISHAEGLKFRITAPAFDQLSVGGSGSIRVLNALHAEKMDMDVSGNGEISCLQSDFGLASISISGSGTVELGGKANELKSDISGSGDVKAKTLTVNNLTVSISGSGTVTADVISKLRADISGSGDVFYSGTPSVESSVSGSGTVKKLEAQ